MFPVDPLNRPTNFLVSNPNDESYRDVCCGVVDRVPPDAGLECKCFCTGVAEISLGGDEDATVDGVAAAATGVEVDSASTKDSLETDNRAGFDLVGETKAAESLSMDLRAIA